VPPTGQIHESATTQPREASAPRATSRYEREATRLLAEAEIAAMESAIAADPEAHPIVPGTGGVRKARWGREGKGKSGGVRIIYFYWLRDGEIYMLSIYAKNEQADMTAADKKAARRFVEALKDAKGKN
jgi:hypothetical protein